MPVSTPLVKPPNLWTCDPGLARIGNAGIAFPAALRPTFYEIIPPCPIYPLQSIRIRVATLSASSTVGVAIYSVLYTAASTFTATLVAQVSSAFSGSAVATLTQDVTSAPILLDFTANCYYIGAMGSNTTVAPVGASATAGAVGSFTFTSGAVLGSTTAWPASFTQTSVAAASGTEPQVWAMLVTAEGKNTL